MRLQANMTETEEQFKEDVGNGKINYFQLNIKLMNSKIEFDIYKKSTQADAIILTDTYHFVNYKTGSIKYIQCVTER